MKDKILIHQKRWRLKSPCPSEFIENFPAYSGIILQLLYDRGLDTQEKIDDFFNPDYSQGIHDPFLFLDMRKAVARIETAIKNKEKILIHGDYDADGVTATVVLEKTLSKLGAIGVDFFIPHRDLDGYGLNLKNAENFVAQGINLVITVDCGITNFEAIKFLKEKNIDTIIVDHHLELENLPDAYAILNCSLKREAYPYKKLAGVGMVFKLAQALFLQQKNSEQYAAFEKWLLDLVAIGTIGDVSPILGENRTLVKYGLMVLNKTPRKGLQELICIASLSSGEELKGLPLGSDLYNLNVRNISFQIVPRLNAAGRIDHASLAYNLLTTEDEMTAIALAQDIQNKNIKRQKIAEQMLIEAKKQFDKVSDKNKILIACQENWTPGLVGLVAGKLKDEFFRPVILFAHQKDTYIGSGRSIVEFNITEALQSTSALLERFGGHSQACGLSIKGEKNYQDFLKKITLEAEKKLKNTDLKPAIDIDMEIKLADLNWELYDQLEQFEPFAEANPMPLFLIKKLKIEQIESVGKDSKHLRFYFSQNNLSRKAISFGTAEEWGSVLKIGDLIDAVVEFGINEWNGNRELQLKVVDIKLSS